MLLRVGIDKGSDNALAPIFEDGTFEYIPISEVDPDSRENRTYKNTLGRNGTPFAHYLPKKIWNRKMHFDPEFETFTYGDSTSKRNSLLKLEKGYFLVFYAGLTPYKHDKYEEALYIIGYFTVDNVIDFNQLSKKDLGEIYKLYANNAHLKRISDIQDLVMIAGDKKRSKLFEKAILISEKET